MADTGILISLSSQQIPNFSLAIIDMVIKHLKHLSHCQNSFLTMFHSVHWGINPASKTLPPPLSCQAPPLNRQTAQAPLFLAITPSILVFREPPLKVGFFSEPPKYESFSSLIPSYLLKVTKFLLR